MAKMFYNAKEAASKLGKSDDELKNLVRDGKLREFRDGGGSAYRVEDVDRLAAGPGARSGAAESGIELAPLSNESSVALAPIGDSDVMLSPSATDVVNLRDAEKPGKGGKRDKHDSVVGSVGVSVFDDDELEKAVDPLAQTQISDSPSLGADGGGSGILGLSRERDDTSLGAELLDEIYEEGASGVEMGDATRAGLDEAVRDVPTSSTTGDVFRSAALREAELPQAPALPPPGPRISAASSADAATTAMTAVLVVALVVMLFAGLVVSAMVHGVTPGVVTTVNNNLLAFTGGAVGVAVIAALASFFVAKRG